MHRNTFILVVFLALFATLVVIANIFNKEEDADGIVQKENGETLQIVTSPTPTTHQLGIQIYTNKKCGFSLLYPGSYVIQEEESGSASLTDRNSDDAIIMTCQKEIPRPPLPTANIDEIQIANRGKTATVSGKLYHDASPKDGTPIDALIFHNDALGIDIFVAGYGEVFTKMLSTITVL